MKETLKVVLLLSSIDQTGLTTHTLDLTKGLSQLGHKVYLIYGGLGHDLPQIKAMEDDFRAHAFQLIAFPNPQHKSTKWDKTWTGIRSVVYIMQTIRSIKPDVIHAQSPYMSFIPWLMRKKFVSTLHVCDLVRTFRYKNATHLIAISQETKAYAKQVYGYPEATITIVNHGVSRALAQRHEESSLLEFKKDLEIPNNKVIIGMVASIEFRKGHDVLLKAIQVLPENIRNQCHIVMLGSSKDNATNDWLQQVIDQTQTRSQVSICAYQNPKKFYEIMDIFTLPSRLEGFPMVVLEALMSGCCVVRTNTEGASEQITDGVDGFVVPVDDFQALASVLSKLISDESLRKKIAKVGQQKAMEQFSIETMTSKIVSIYQEKLVKA
ncbi:MAG: hypothetical protein RL607_529 [Bacteroidota bacterium]|jgi:glycosyltransferase involved in cell wall biosynthesis